MLVANVMPRSSHMTPPTDADQLRKLQAYSLRDLRGQLTKGTVTVGANERARMVALITPRAATEKSQDLTLEIFQLLAYWNERDAIEASLRSCSVGDQELIRGVVGE
jgi:hypothetical protein